MNHEEWADPWFSGRPQAPPWDAIEYNQLISAGPLLPLLEQYTSIGSYDTTTQAEIPWQVATQGAIGDRYAGDQLQVANVANQGPSCNTLQPDTCHQRLTQVLMVQPHQQRFRGKMHHCRPSVMQIQHTNLKWHTNFDWHMWHNKALCEPGKLVRLLYGKTLGNCT
ncbi:uncharacterized protein [Triticum aestivum]|uniref:uncharacterized protein n=1 Tax=Triticum aestivum TaxID=4565 RepID=UPI001D020B51|nr:uncharacterized protein LOC123133732 [Triticum aestivum]